jgi:ppGpp synthetase/RelA/SpoT-type nucleotidyltranferase
VFSGELFEALIDEGKAFKVGTTRHWKDGDYLKVAPGVWEKLPKTRGEKVPHGRRLATDAITRARAAAEMDPAKLKRTMTTLRKTVKEGKLAKGMSAEDHVVETDAVVALHTPGFNDFIEKMNRIAPEATTTRARMKVPESILGKLSRKPDEYARTKDMTDISAAQIVLKKNSDVRRVVAKLKRKFDIVESEDLIKKPKGDYRSHHLLIKDDDGLVKEVQIRTENQDDFANWSHNVYKPLNRRQENLVKKYKKQIETYSKGTADHFDDLDHGRVPKHPRPDCPPVVRAAVDCVP